MKYLNQRDKVIPAPDQMPATEKIVKLRIQLIQAASRSTRKANRKTNLAVLSGQSMLVVAIIFAQPSMSGRNQFAIRRAAGLAEKAVRNILYAQRVLLVMDVRPGDVRQRRARVESRHVEMKIKMDLMEKGKIVQLAGTVMIKIRT